MINILPESGRSIVKREYRIRLVAVFLFLLALLSLVTAVMLMPSYLFAEVEAEQAELEEARLVSAKVEGAKSDAEVITAVNKQIVGLDAFMMAPRPSEALLVVLQSAGSGIEVVRVSYEGGTNSVSLSGKATSRDTLLQFSKALQKLPIVLAVDLPVSDLAKNTDVSFNMTLTLKK